MVWKVVGVQYEQTLKETLMELNASGPEVELAF